MSLSSFTGESLAIARIALVALPAFLFYGYNQSNLGGVLSYPSFIQHFPQMDTTTTTGSAKTRNARIQGTVVAIYTLGCLMGALGMSQVGNRIGRRKSLVLAAIVAIVGIAIQASAFHLPQLIIGRIIIGIGNGGMNSMVPVWQSECTKPKSRGKNVVVIGIFIAAGIAIAGWVNYGLAPHSSNEFAWRLPLALPAIFAVVVATFTMSFPESPRWLVGQGKEEEARECMVKLSGKQGQDIDSINTEITIMVETSQLAAESERGFKHLFTMGPQRLFYRLCLAFTVNFMAQMTGANVISYYGTTIFKESLHLTSRKAALLNAGVLTWKIVAAVFAFLTVDRLGRKPLFITAGLGMGISMAGLAGTVWAIDYRYTFGATVAATFFLFLFVAFFPLGFLAANFLYSSEIAPQDLRVHFAAVGTATHWLFNFLVAEITPIAFVTIGWRYYVVYAVVGISVGPIVYFLFPETKGILLENMEILFSSPDHFWQVPSVARTRDLTAQDVQEHHEKVTEDRIEKI